MRGMYLLSQNSIFWQVNIFDCYTSAFSSVVSVVQAGAASVWPSLIGLPISFVRPMVFDSLFQKMSQNLPVYLQMSPPPPRNEKVGFQVKVTFWFWMMYPPPQ